MSLIRVYMMNPVQDTEEQVRMGPEVLPPSAHKAISHSHGQSMLGRFIS